MARYPERLLAQAPKLARRDRFRPEQVNLRSSVSGVDCDLNVQWRRGDVLVQITAVEAGLEYLRRERSARDLRAFPTSILVWNRISSR